MSSLALPHAADSARPRRAGLVSFFARHGSDVLLGLALAALGTVLLAYLPSAFSVDSWLALVGGRELWQSGLPHHETLTSLAQGAAWIDQQWLAQLSTYGLFRLGGLALVGFANVALMVAGVGGAVAAARRLGASPRAVAAAIPFCIWLVFPSREVRTQAFAIPLFVALVYLLASDSRASSRRVYWCLPMLALWANLHGTVSLGILLVALRGVTLAWERRAALLSSRRQWVRPVVLTLGAPLCLLLTPYGLGALPYYRTIFLGGSIMHAVTEWQPVTASLLIAVPFFFVAGFALWSFGRHADRTSLWERLAVIALAAGSAMVVRNVLFFALAAVVLIPRSIELQASPASPDRPPIDRRRGTINFGLSAAALSVVLVAVAATFVRPAHQVEFSSQRQGVLSAVDTATRTDPGLKVMADVRFADWLLWRDPRLRGRIATDARFELLTASQIKSQQRLLSAVGPDWKRGARGYRLIVLDRRYNPDAALGFLQEAGRRVLYNDGARVVILRSASPAG